MAGEKHQVTYKGRLSRIKEQSIQLKNLKLEGLRMLYFKF